MNHSETNPTAVAARAKSDLPDSRNHESQAERTGRDLTRTVLRAEGFSCPSCVAKVEKGVARLRQVRVGPRVGDTVLVLSGLRAGERVALEPIAVLRP